ncbi:MAG: peptide MFS transporter [Candidatus Aminicenantes bacterium]|nr:peptide MFS transporter [Candidatus Aminicenantes bacterium]
MFKEHPKGLIVAFFSNMGERFGFYTMMAILVLFLQARYGLSAESASGYYSSFYFAIYALALFGGLIADATSKYKLVIGTGIVVMLAGYVIMALPGMPLALTLVGLFTIAFGNGLFKGNLQAVVGQMYDNPQYAKVRDTAYMIFYMGINVGAFFAPYAATSMRNWFLRSQGFEHDGSLPAICHAFLGGRLTDSSAIGHFEGLAGRVSGQVVSGAEQLTAFANHYLEAFSKGYNYAFGVAGAAMIVSLLVFVIFNKYLPNKTKKKAEGGLQPAAAKAMKGASGIIIAGLVTVATAFLFKALMNDFEVGLAVGLFIGFVAMIVRASTKEEKPRVMALVMVFVVVVFFWMSFHQNGLTQTFFARDYTVKEVDPLTNIFFNLKSILPFIAAVAGLIMFFTRKKPGEKALSLAAFLGFGGLTYYIAKGYVTLNPIAPEIFQSFNPLFIVVLTFPVMGVFAWLRKRNQEPSTPRKIGIGMIIASVGFIIMLVGSLKLVSPGAVAAQGLTEWGRVSPYWLISSYLTLTIAELFLSPMGLSFVSKVSPERFQGLMQGGWLLATATGNKLLFVGGYLWDRVDLSIVWGIFVACCLLSAAFIFSIMKKLERVTS